MHGLQTAGEGTVRLPRPRRGPLWRLSLRLGLAVGLVLFVTAVAYLGRGGYRDADGGSLSLLDALYYATVSVTTTGYGDITPLTEQARLLSTILVTPARVLFLIVLVGTTVEILADSSRTAFREQIWRRKLRDHIVVCGYGTKGRAALEVLHGQGRSHDEVVVVETSADNVEEANRRGHAAIHGDASRSEVLRQAGVEGARAILVAVERDDTAVLITLTARELNPRATLAVAVREEENRHLLHQSGADTVITSSGAAGRMLGFAAHTPRVVEVLEDLLTVGTGLDLVERDVAPEQVGARLGEMSFSAPVIAVVRGDDLLRFDNAEIGALRADDRLVCLCSLGEPDTPAKA